MVEEMISDDYLGYVRRALVQKSEQLEKRVSRTKAMIVGTATFGVLLATELIARAVGYEEQGLSEYFTATVELVGATTAGVATYFADRRFPRSYTGWFDYSGKKKE